MISETAYARNGDLSIAYRTSGDGPRDILFASNWFSNVEAMPDLALWQPWHERITKLGRIIFYDQLGTGASDPVSLDSLPTLEQWTDTLTAVLDTVGSREVVLMASDAGLLTAAMFAATYPNRVSELIVMGGWPRVLRDDDFPMGFPKETWDAGLAITQTMWGTGEWQRQTNPDYPWDERSRADIAKMERLAASPSVFRRMATLAAELDVRDVLPSIRVPTLVLHHTKDRIVNVEVGRYVAERIPGAKFVEIPGRNHYLFIEPGWRRAYEEISEFLTGTRSSYTDDDRVLATVMFTDIVGSTEKASEMGDRPWRDLLEAQVGVLRKELERFRGREIKQIGDGCLATFDGPARAIRCGLSMIQSVRALGIDIRVGLHTGEVEMMGDDVGGIAVHIASRINGLAQPGTVYTSGTVKDLVAGSGIAFEDRGMHVLKGVPDEWRVLEVAG